MRLEKEHSHQPEPEPLQCKRGSERPVGRMHYPFLCLFYSLARLAWCAAARHSRCFSLSFTCMHNVCKETDLWIPGYYFSLFALTVQLQVVLCSRTRFRCMLFFKLCSFFSSLLLYSKRRCKECTTRAVADKLLMCIFSSSFDLSLFFSILCVACAGYSSSRSTAGRAAAEVQLNLVL